MRLPTLAAQTRIAAALAAAVLFVVGAAAGCGSGGDDVSGVRIMVPNQPGGGYDVTARAAAKALEDARILRDVEVFNLPGGSGTVGLQRLVYEKGNGKLMMLMGLGVVGSQYTMRSASTLQATTPIARLIEEPCVVVVHQDSPYRTLDELVAGWREAPSRVAVGGGSVVGGPDHLATMLVARAVGVAPPRVRYTEHDGGGDLLAAIVKQEVAFGVTGISESLHQIKSGALRVLAVTGDRPVPDVAAPTLREAGVDVVFANWRGIVAPPGLAARDVDALRAAIAQLHASASWKAAVARNGWTDAYLAGDAFGAFLQQQNDQLGGVLRDLGLA